MRKWKQRKLSQRERIRVLTKMSQLIDQGYSFMQSMHIISLSSSTHQRYWLEKISSSLEQGHSLEQAFRQALFSEYVTLMLSQAEIHGDIAETLHKASEWKQRRLRMNREWKKVFTYPVILLVVMAMIVYLVTVMVIPQFQSMFQTFQVEVPRSTQMMLSGFQWLTDNFAFLLVMGVGVAAACFFLFRTTTRIRFIDWSLKLPILKGIMQTYYSVLFSIQLGFLLRSSVPLYKSLQKMIDKSSSLFLKQHIIDIEAHILEGKSLGEAIEKKELFAPELYPMIYYAERNGQLAERLIQFGTLLEQEMMEKWVERIKWIEPFLLIGIGGLIAYLFFALFSPILELIQNI